MSVTMVRIPTLTRWALLACLGLTLRTTAQNLPATFAPSIPTTWVDSEIAELEIPLARVELSPRHVSADFYYRIRERPVYKTYPIYAPGREPAGYFEWLKQQEPEVVFDPGKLKTEADWIAAGELVFENTDGGQPVTAGSPVRDPAYYEKLGIRLTKEGINPYQRYVIREKGKVELRIFACADCHTRVLDDGTIVKGAQSNFPHHRAFNFDIEKRRTQVEASLKAPRPVLPWASWQGDRATSFEHRGSVMTLDDWFDSNRLKDDYVPTGFRGPGLVKQAAEAPLPKPLAPLADGGWGDVQLRRHLAVVQSRSIGQYDARPQGHGLGRLRPAREQGQFLALVGRQFERLLGATRPHSPLSRSGLTYARYF